MSEDEKSQFNFAAHRGEQKRNMVLWVLSGLIFSSVLYAAIRTSGVFSNIPEFIAAMVMIFLAGRGYRWACSLLAILLLADAALLFYELPSPSRYGGGEFRRLYLIAFGIIELGCAFFLYFDLEIREYLAQRSAARPAG